jgi:hypothetical protein
VITAMRPRTLVSVDTGVSLVNRPPLRC